MWTHAMPAVGPGNSPVHQTLLLCAHPLSHPLHCMCYAAVSSWVRRCLHAAGAALSFHGPCPTLQRVPEDTKAAGYRTWLGFYKGYCGKIGWSPEELVQQANYFSEVIGEQ